MKKKINTQNLDWRFKEAYLIYKNFKLRGLTMKAIEHELLKLS